jgi:hypothetical protein
VEIRPRLHAEKQGKTTHLRGQNPLFWKNNQKFRCCLPDLRVSDNAAARRQDPQESKEERPIFRGRIEGKRAGESVNGNRLDTEEASRD